jgi:hypothetical protein
MWLLLACVQTPDRMVTEIDTTLETAWVEDCNGHDDTGDDDTGDGDTGDGDTADTGPADTAQPGPEVCFDHNSDRFISPCTQPRAFFADDGTVELITDLNGGAIEGVVVVDYTQTETVSDLSNDLRQTELVAGAPAQIEAWRNEDVLYEVDVFGTWEPIALDLLISQEEDMLVFRYTDRDVIVTETHIRGDVRERTLQLEEPSHCCCANGRVAPSLGAVFAAFLLARLRRRR